MEKILLFLLLAFATLQANDDLFLERFADPATRTAAIAELIPGTQTAYFHTALDHQLAGRTDVFQKTMAAWKAASERKDHPISNASMDVLENRQLFIAYEKDPLASLTEIIRLFGLDFSDTQPDAAAAESLPTRLDPDLISESAFENAAAKRSPEDVYTQFKGPRLFRELDQVENFSDEKIRWFINHLDRADLPSVVPLIDRSLSIQNPVPFGSVPIHQWLTSSQLQTLLELHPVLRSNESFTHACLTKIRPGAETDFERDLPSHAEYLRLCRDFAVTLPPSQNSLKAHILFHHLRLQAETGNYPRADLLAYLALPRVQHDFLKTHETAPPTAVNTLSDFSTITACPPVRDDALHLQAWISHFLSESDSAAEFAPYIPDRTLTQLHAHAKLLAGADLARWGSMISPAEFKSLQNETRLSFAPGAPKLLHADTPVSLTLDLKNTPELLIRIYEIDLPTHLARHSTEPDVNIDLDGLVPHLERRLIFGQAPMLLHRKLIDLPELSGSGRWLIDFTSGQISARALIRKGNLTPYPEQTSDGQSLRIFDENGNPVPSAKFSLGLETFAADSNGRILIPDAPDQAVTDGIITAGKLATAVTLESRKDNIELRARFHLDREQLIADQEAQLHLRIRLTNHGHEIPLDRLQDPALVLKAELLGGLTTERVLSEKLTLAPVLQVPFQVPADLLKLTLTLRGTVIPNSDGDPIKLNANETFNLNQDLKEATIGTAFFSPTAEGHRLEVRGRNGEPLPSRAITLICRRQDYIPTVEIATRTDANGRIELGTLDGISHLTAKGTDIDETIFSPTIRKLTTCRNLNLPAGKEIRIPLTDGLQVLDHTQFSLLETREEKIIRDHFDKLSIQAGELLIRDLPPGDFRLGQNHGFTHIRISSSRETDGLLRSNTRIMPVQGVATPTITAAVIANNQLQIQLKNSQATTRVTVIAKRYLHGGSHKALHPIEPPSSPTLVPGFIGCEFLKDKRLSDEMRYILARRSLTTFPGSLLPRPGLLLNRWTEEDLLQDVLPSLPGTEGTLHQEAAKRSSQAGELGESSDPFGGERPQPTVCDFLQFPARVRFDLTPEPDGSLRLPLAPFEGSQFLEIIATDLFGSDTRILPLPANETPLRDRRIARPLDPQAHHLAHRNSTVLNKGAETAIENLLDADWRAFTTLTEAHQFLYGMTTDDRLREFTFLTEWPTLPDAKKLELLSKHACHEFHLFLARKDRPFFDQFVKPLLAGKPEPQFMDDFLLERDLSTYLRPYAWKRLNAAEKALLSQALPVNRDRIARELFSRWELEAPAPDTETTLFSQTLRGSDLALQDSLGLAEKNLIGGATADAGDETFTRVFQVPPDFATSLFDQESSDSSGEDPFASTPKQRTATLMARKPISELLKNVGIHLPPGSSATLASNGRLIVTATTQELDKVGQLTQSMGAAEINEAEPFASNLPELPASSSFPMTPATPASVVPTFPERTRLYREANYYRNTLPTDETLIPLNRFWLDLAAWDGKGPFLSPHFNTCHTSAADALLCLALLDLPFKAERPEVTVVGSTLKVKAREPMLLFYKNTRRTEDIAPESPLLVRQTFSPLDEPFRTVNGRQVENPVIGDFRPGVAYAASLIVTNPTGMGRRIDLLAQIPAGSIPLKGKPATLSSTHEIKPYGVVMSELAFYFPAAGDFAVYPLHVNSEGRVLAHTAARILRVSNNPPTTDTASWSVIASQGSNEQILQRLSTDNLATLDLSALCWRLEEPAFFLSVTKILRERLHFSVDVMSYGFLHNDLASIRESLENSETPTQLGQWLDSPWLNVRPRVHLGWETLEFDPLINSRAHRIGDESRLTHAAAREHYQNFLKQLAWKPKLASADHLTLAAFLFLQDRTEEALARFDQIDPTALPGRLNYDYLHSVVLFHREQAAAAKAIATRTLPTLPPGLWRERFQAISDQADEVAALEQPTATAPNTQALPIPHFDLALAKNGDLVIDHLSPEKTTLRLFSIDLEVLFSQNPFLLGNKNHEAGTPSILSKASFTIPPATIDTQVTLALPPALRKGNVLVTADSTATKRLQVLDSQALQIRHTPQIRSLQITDTATAKPLPKTYIKVYRETRDATIEFHKDGYTDLRGKFDYLSHTAIDPSTIKRVALLIHHPENGARIVIYDL